MTKKEEFIKLAIQAWHEPNISVDFHNVNKSITVYNHTLGIIVAEYDEVLGVDGTDKLTQYLKDNVE